MKNERRCCDALIECIYGDWHVKSDLVYRQARQWTVLDLLLSMTKSFLLIEVLYFNPILSYSTNSPTVLYAHTHIHTHRAQILKQSKIDPYHRILRHCLPPQIRHFTATPLHSRPRSFMDFGTTNNRVRCSGVIIRSNVHIPTNTPRSGGQGEHLAVLVAGVREGVCFPEFAVGIIFSCDAGRAGLGR